MNSVETLKPCPFCASKDVEVRATITDVQVCCNNCGARTGLVYLGADDVANALQTKLAITAWNTRPNSDADALRDLEACERAIDRMGWPEIDAFMHEPGQSPYEDAGGFLLRKIKTLFGIKPDHLETYQEAARRLVAEARKTHLSENNNAQ